MTWPGIKPRSPGPLANADFAFPADYSVTLEEREKKENDLTKELKKKL